MQLDSVQQRSAKQLIVEHLCRKPEDRCFFVMESTVVVPIYCAKKVQRDQHLFFALNRLLLSLTYRKSAGNMFLVAAGPPLQRTSSASDLWKTATGLHL